MHDIYDDLPVNISWAFVHIPHSTFDLLNI